MKHISSIIGQERAKEALSRIFCNSLLGGAVDRAFRPRLIHGPSGTGKTHLINQLKKDLAEMGIPSLHIKDSAALALQSGPMVDTLCNAMNESQYGPQCIILDECQAVLKKDCAMKRDIGQFLFCHGDGVQQYVGGNIAGNQVSCNFKNLIMVLATNEPDSLESSASRKLGQFPIRRRLAEVPLSIYSQVEMEEIIPAYFAGLGYHIGETAAGLVRRLHRGTMEALCDVGEIISDTIHGKATLNKAEVIAACKATEFLPRGLTRKEGKLLERLTHGDISNQKAELILGLSGKPFTDALNHMEMQFLDNGTHFPLIMSPTSAKLRITTAGRKYLSAVKNDGFTF